MQSKQIFSLGGKSSLPHIESDFFLEDHFKDNKFSFLKQITKIEIITVHQEQ